MSKITLEYNEATGEMKDKNGLTTFMSGMVSLESDKAQVLELIKQGVTPDEIIKLKNHDLL